MNISPDQIVLFKIPITKSFAVDINMTLVGTWEIMLFLFIFSKLITKNITTKFEKNRMQNILEVLIKFLTGQIESIMARPAKKFLPLIGSLLVFILVCNWSAILPIPFFVNKEIEWYLPPTASLSTTTSLAIVVMGSVMYYGIKAKGVCGYFKRFFQPVFFLFPLNILSEISSGVSLAVRLYGNIMSGALLGSILFVLMPIIIPGLMNIYGLLAGTIQPYIFAVLAMVYISSGLGETTEEELKALSLSKENII